MLDRSLNPLVSILLPAFNAGPFLDACLRSVTRQTEVHWECIVVDDGSTDDTRGRAQLAAARDARIRVIAGAHRGLVAALNRGLAHCRGRFVARMDADDVMHRERLRAQVAMLEAQPALVAVGSHVRLFPRARLQDGWRAYERWLNTMSSPRQIRAEAFVECPIAHPTLMIRRERLVALGYRECAWPEDYDLILRLLTGGDDVGVVPRRLVSWRDTPGRLTRTSRRYGLERFCACKAAFLAAGFLGHTDTYILWGYGETGRGLCRALRAHGKRPSHVVEVHPGRLGNVIQGAPVIPPAALLAVPHRPLVASVAGAGPRQQIRAALERMEWRELHDFVCAA
jgi:glycosyltransferase involved in cell wall biosynthesis